MKKIFAYAFISALALSSMLVSSCEKKASGPEVELKIRIVNNTGEVMKRLELDYGNGKIEEFMLREGHSNSETVKTNKEQQPIEVSYYDEEGKEEIEYELDRGIDPSMAG